MDQMLFQEADDSVTDWRSFWCLDPDIRFLNHGSFGSCPVAVLERQQCLRSQLEAEPVRFFADALEPQLDQARRALAQFVGSDPEELVFVPNATSGVNAVLRSLSFQPGDELLTTDQEYNASRNVLDFVAERSGATVVVAQVPFPLNSAEEIVEAVQSKVSDRTRLVLLDHVTSQTALIFPLSPLIQFFTSLGIDVLVDGAHAPGMIPLDLRSLGATYYTGNCHKWMCAPKGAAFLYVQRHRQSLIRPTVISHGANSPRTDRSRFQLEFDWMGTGDPTPYLCVPEAIRWMGSLLPGGWPQVMACNRAKVLAARQRMCDRLSLPLPCPDALIGSMATLPLPDGSAERLQSILFRHYRIQVPVFYWPEPPRRFLRISAQLYNVAKDYDDLSSLLVECLDRGDDLTTES